MFRRGGNENGTFQNNAKLTKCGNGTLGKFWIFRGGGNENGTLQTISS